MASATSAADYPEVAPISIRMEKRSILPSGELESSGGKYSAENVADWNYATAWCAGAEGEKRLRLSFAGHKQNGLLVSAFTLRVTPGYVKTNALYFANSRPRTVEIVVTDRRAAGFSLRKQVDFVDAPRAQTFDVELGRTADFYDLIVTLVIKDVFAGTQYADLCISEAEVLPAGVDWLEYVPGERAWKAREREEFLEQVRFLRLLRLDYGNSPRLMFEAVNLLAHSRYFRTAEGAESVGELWLDLFVKYPYEFLRAVEVQEKSVRDFIVWNALVRPINDKYGYDILYRAAKAARERGISEEVAMPLLREFSANGGSSP
jgi:hypothetical protein